MAYTGIDAALEKERQICVLTDELQKVVEASPADSEVAVGAVARLLHLLSSQAETEAAAHARPRASGRTATVIETLRAHPRMRISELANAVYGASDRNSQGKLRSLMAALKKQKRIKRVGPGRWVVVK
jgi:hypothetical protein